ncbi:response regulator [Streptomyces sp. AJS327]|uniref:response regulator n=1 Tax=Streptomyces sp. AJS327 TaxID=2545265 RepID=UPI0015DD61EC|nr:response regulator [Streptomyces sp. AJS327]MBA0049925.1 response regulator [Streptomyces sp. AJS327]
MLSVLVVDDDFMVARLHSTLVERVPGFRVAGVAHSGSTALEAARRERPDLVLLDMYLPDIPGLAVLRALRGGAWEPAGPDEPLDELDVLVVTAAQDARTVRAARRCGAVQYLIKPFEGVELRERLLDYAAGRRESEALTAPGQAEVDRLFGAGAGGASARGTRARAAPGAGRDTGRDGARAWPKGLTEQTASLVRGALESLGEEGSLSASECAELCGLSRVSARRYLEHFTTVGEARVSLRYGTTGRPERRYHHTGPRGGSMAHAPDATGTPSAPLRQLPPLP